MFTLSMPLFAQMQKTFFDILDKIDLDSSVPITERILSNLNQDVAFIPNFFLEKLDMSAPMFYNGIQQWGGHCLILDQAFNSNKIEVFGIIFSKSEELLIQKSLEIKSLAQSLNVYHVKEINPRYKYKN